MRQSVQVRPVHPSVWLFGEAGGVQVWAAEGDARVRVGVYISDGPPVIVLNRRLVDTPAEHDAISWAMDRIAERVRGYYVWCASTA